MKINLYHPNGVILQENVEEGDVEKAKSDYSLMYNINSSEIKVKYIPENIEEEDIMNGVAYPAHEMYLDEPIQEDYDNHQ